ncbi:Metallothionein expression activator [Pseudocyphellaria aurata]|nr:Metallothionein expression activator [Pseudocyphellaria aurata]
MLSNQTSNLPPGHHRRQNSTPTVFDTLKVPLLPATRPRHGSHRRGLSLDQSTNIHQHQRISPQDDRTVNNRQQQQHNVQETQQQPQQLARPGQQPTQPQPRDDEPLRKFQLKPYPEYDSSTLTPVYFSDQGPLLNDHKQTDMNNSYKNENMNITKSLDSDKFAGYLEGFEFEVLDNALDAELKKGFSTQDAIIYDNLLDRAIMPHATNERQLRPYTPPTQSSTCYFPITPATTPFSPASNPQRAAGTRTAGSSPTRKDPNLTIRASHAMKRGSSCQEAFSKNPGSCGSGGIPSPPHSASKVLSRSADTTTFPPFEFLNMTNIKMDFPTNDDIYGSSHCSPTSNAISPTVSSFQSSPEMKHLSLGTDSKIGVLEPSIGQSFSLPPPQINISPSAHPTKEEPHSRSQSVSELELDASVDDTGITPEEIAAFMYGPRPDDHRWVCIFPGCTRTFGRKENIKSHVQTHLGDRQFICNVCGNDFVRQHDLKRHAKIHSGVKPYTCPCSRTFARHDALTRHRQRNTCDGGFAGISRTPTKRGRPKKVKPDTDKRLEKAAKTRQRALEKAYPSSISGSSECSFPSPPPMADDMDTRETSSFDEIESLQANLTEFLSSTPPTSPGYSTGNCFSSHNSQHSYTPKGVSMSPSPKITSISEEPRDMLPSHAMSRASSISYYSTPPELDISSSSPVLHSFLDFDGGFKTNTTASAPEAKDSSSGFDLLSSDHDIDQMFVDGLGSGDAMTSLDKDPLFLLENFEDPFAAGNPWQEGFDENSDNFFDSLG